MPALYQGICGHCGYTTPWVSGGYGAVFVDQPIAGPQSEVAGAVLLSTSRGQLAETRDSRFVVLSHPIEDSILASTGYTWRDLFWQGRYVGVRNMICRQCGTAFQRRRLEAPGTTGCLSALVSASIASIAIGTGMMIAGAPWSDSMLLGLVVFFAGTPVGFLIVNQGVAKLYLRWRFRDRAASLAAERACPACQADDATPIDRAKAVVCPACRTTSLRFGMAGIS